MRKNYQKYHPQKDQIDKQVKFEMRNFQAMEKRLMEEF